MAAGAEGGGGSPEGAGEEGGGAVSILLAHARARQAGKPGAGGGRKGKRGQRKTREGIELSRLAAAEAAAGAEAAVAAGALGNQFVGLEAVPALRAKLDEVIGGGSLVDVTALLAEINKDKAVREQLDAGQVCLLAPYAVDRSPGFRSLHRRLLACKFGRALSPTTVEHCGQVFDRDCAQVYALQRYKQALSEVETKTKANRLAEMDSRVTASLTRRAWAAQPTAGRLGRS